MNHFAGLLSAQLVGLINKDYAEFVRLSSSLLGAEQLTESLAGSISEMNQQVGDVQRVVSDRMNEIQRCVEEIAQSDRRVAQLQLFLSLMKGVEKVEHLMKDPLHLDLERLGEEFYQLEALVARDVEQEYVGRVSKRISGAKNTLLMSLEETFRQQLLKESDRDQKMLRQCLSTYEALQRTDVPESLVRVLVVAPAVRLIVTAEHLEGGKRHSCDGLDTVFRALLKWAQSEGCALLELLGHHTQADFLTNSVFAEIASAIKQHSKTVFATGIPEAYHRNYSLMIEWISGMEKLYPSQDAVKRFRNSKVYASWQRNWKSEVYFSLRSQHMIKDLTEALNPGFEAELTVKRESGSKFFLRAFELSWKAAEYCWQEDMFLPGLQTHLLRFCLKVLMGLVNWKPPSPETQPPLTWMHMYHDSGVLLSLLPDYIKRVEEKFYNVVQLQSVFDEPLEQLVQLQKTSEQMVLSRLSAATSTKLQFLRQIPTRCLAGDMPSSPSQQVGSILAPLKEILEAAENVLDDTLLQQWKRTAIDDLLAHYTSMGEGGTSDVEQNSIIHCKESWERRNWRNA